MHVESLKNDLRHTLSFNLGVQGNFRKQNGILQARPEVRCRTCDARCSPCHSNSWRHRARQGCPVFLSRPGLAAPQPSWWARATSEVTRQGSLRGQHARKTQSTHIWAKTPFFRLYPRSFWSKRIRHLKCSEHELSTSFAPPCVLHVLAWRLARYEGEKHWEKMTFWVEQVEYSLTPPHKSVSAMNSRKSVVVKADSTSHCGMRGILPETSRCTFCMGTRV